MRISSGIFICLFGLTSIFNSSFAKDKDIVFERGTMKASVLGTVIRGELDTYALRVKAGQTLNVSVLAAEQNAAFQIYLPGYKVKKVDRLKEITGETLPGAGETDDATNWQGVIPASGKYLVVVGGTRGNATYGLNVEVK